MKGLELREAASFSYSYIVKAFPLAVCLSRVASCKVLREPQPHFDVIKRHYPHFIHRRARNGCPVWIELPGRIDLPAIRSGGVTAEALQRHYVFVTEYLWGVVEPDFENGQAVTVLDVQGLGMRDLAGEALGFVKVCRDSDCRLGSSSSLTRLEPEWCSVGDGRSRKKAGGVNHA